MKRSHYLLICLLLPFIVTAQTWKSFSDTSIRFTAKYPSNWVNKIKDDKRVFFTSPAENADDDFYENVNVGVSYNTAFNSSFKIKDAMPEVISSLENSIKDFSLESQRFFKWNNVDACEVIYTGHFETAENMDVKIVQWLCPTKGKLYTATYTCKDTNTIYWADAMKIMSSIVFR